MCRIFSKVSRWQPQVIELIETCRLYWVYTSAHSWPVEFARLSRRLGISSVPHHAIHSPRLEANVHARARYLPWVARPCTAVCWPKFCTLFPRNRHGQSGRAWRLYRETRNVLLVYGWIWLVQTEWSNKSVRSGLIIKLRWTWSKCPWKLNHPHRLYILSLPE